MQQKHEDPQDQSSTAQMETIVYMVACVIFVLLLVSVETWIFFAPESMYSVIHDMTVMLLVVVIGTLSRAAFTFYPFLSRIVKKVIRVTLIVLSLIIFLITVMGEIIIILLFIILNYVFEE